MKRMERCVTSLHFTRFPTPHFTRLPNSKVLEEGKLLALRLRLPLVNLASACVTLTGN
jgi:hypothetical protein